MKYIITTATKKIDRLTKRIRGISGGTGASKTDSILLWLIDYAQTHDNQVISGVAESFPHLRRGAMREFLDIMESENYFDPSRWVGYTYKFETGTKFEFFSVQDSRKVRGPRRDVLFVNEANNIPFETYNQLEIRTNKIIFLDWNPVSEFWWYTDVEPHFDVDFLKLTYRDNEALDPNIIESIEARKWNKNWWRVYGEGELGEIESRIFTGWRIIKGIPKDARLIRYGLDFGYSNDPAVIVAVYKFNDWLIFDEVCYQKGLDNSQLAKIFLGIPKALVRADSSEPKSIDEIRKYGVSILPSAKGPGSVLAGIQFLQQKKIAITERSVNGIKEYRNYLWITDNNGKIINEPSPIWNHFMDAIRYALDDLRVVEEVRGGPVRPEGPTPKKKQWTATPEGAIKGPDFIKAFAEESKRRKSTAGLEFRK